MGGSGASPNTSGAPFAKQDVVLVAANYRLGRFGFFAGLATLTDDVLYGDVWRRLDLSPSGSRDTSIPRPTWRC
jgi:hypothetical protein